MITRYSRNKIVECPLCEHVNRLPDILHIDRKTPNRSLSKIVCGGCPADLFVDVDKRVLTSFIPNRVIAVRRTDED